MNWKTYKNELIVVGALLFMLIGFGYKQGQVSGQTANAGVAKTQLYELKEVIALQKVWADKKTSKKVEKLQTLVAPSKLKWQKKSKKVTASFTSLSANELNKVISKILNLAVQIQKLNIKKSGASYSVEFKCKW
jgi:hypothetical protein